MSRPIMRTRPVDINKKLPVIKSIRELEDDDVLTSVRSYQTMRLTSEAHHEVRQVPSKKVSSESEIPTPEFVIVDTYERDYSRTFVQPTSYLRARGARAELGEFVEYDLDNEDEDWLQEFNKERNSLAAEKLETIIFKLEVLDHKTRERAGVIASTLGSPIPVLLTFEAAVEALQAINVMYRDFQSIYFYWKEKRGRWKKPILRRLQPPPPANDTNPYNVFRPRAKAHRLHTRRQTQRRENNVQSFEKLRQVRRNLEQTRNILDALIKREEKKRELCESEVSLQRIQMTHKTEAGVLDEYMTVPGLPSYPSKVVSSEEEFVDFDEMVNQTYLEPKRTAVPAGNRKQEARRPVAHGWLHRLDPDEPVMLFTKPLHPEKLAAAGIIPPSGPSVQPPSDPSAEKDIPASPFNMRGRIGRGGRIVFDRWNPLMHTPIDCSKTL